MKIKQFIFVILALIGIGLLSAFLRDIFSSPDIEAETLVTAENGGYIARHDIAKYRDGYIESQINITSEQNPNKVQSLTIAKQVNTDEIANLSNTKLEWLNDEKPHLLVTLALPNQFFDSNDKIQLDNVLVSFHVPNPNPSFKRDAPKRAPYVIR